MSTLFDKLFKTKECKQRFGMLYESFLKSKRRSRYQTERTYRVKSNTSLIDKSKFLYDIPDSMIFPNTATIDETEENADVFLKEFGDLLDKDYYLPERILNLLGLCHLINGDDIDKDDKSKEKTPQSDANSNNTILNKTSTATNVKCENIKKNNDFDDLMNKIKCLKKKYQTIGSGMTNTSPTNIKKRRDDTTHCNNFSPKCPSHKSNSSNESSLANTSIKERCSNNNLSSEEPEIIFETPTSVFRHQNIPATKRKENDKIIPKIPPLHGIRSKKKTNVLQKKLNFQNTKHKQISLPPSGTAPLNHNLTSPGERNTSVPILTHVESQNKELSSPVEDNSGNITAKYNKSQSIQTGRPKSKARFKKKKRKCNGIENNLMIPHPLSLDSNKSIDVMPDLAGHSLHTGMRHVPCIQDSFTFQEENVDKKPLLPEFVNEENQEELPFGVTDTRRPLIFLKNTALLLKEPERSLEELERNSREIEKRSKEPIKATPIENYHEPTLPIETEPFISKAYTLETSFSSNIPCDTLAVGPKQISALSESTLSISSNTITGNSLSETRSDSTAQVDNCSREDIYNWNQTQVDFFNKILEQNSQIMNILRKQQTAIKELKTRMKKSCKKCQNSSRSIRQRRKLRMLESLV